MKNCFLFHSQKESTFLSNLREKRFKSIIGNIEDNYNLERSNNKINKLKNIIREFSIDESFEDENNIIYILATYKEVLMEFKPGIYQFNEKIELINDIVKNIKKKKI